MGCKGRTSHWQRINDFGSTAYSHYEMMVRPECWKKLPMPSTARHGNLRHGTDPRGTAREFVARHEVSRHGTGTYGTARSLKARHGNLWHGTKSQSTARHGTGHPWEYEKSDKCWVGYSGKWELGKRVGIGISRKWDIGSSGNGHWDVGTMVWESESRRESGN